MAETESVADAAEGPDHAAARTQMRSILESKVSGLPEALRVVFVLRSVEELSVAETAETLGITQETVRMRHFRSKGLLREALAREIDLAEAVAADVGLGVDQPAHRAGVDLAADPAERALAAALVADLDGRIWKRTIPPAELPAYREKFQVLSTRRFAGQTLIHVYSNQQPDSSCELVRPDMEDLYFATIKGFMAPAAAAAKVN